MPLFEAISNSLHAIEDTKRKDGLVRIRIVRDASQQTVSDGSGQWGVRPIVDFEVSDNGMGFTSENFTSFCTADSLAKLTRGGKGIGRLLWLKAFDTVEVDSTFFESGSWQRRAFRFVSDTQNAITNHELNSTSTAEHLTTVRLIGFKNPYRDHTRHRPDTIVERIIRHCRLSLLNPSCPTIVVRDDDAQADVDVGSQLKDGKVADLSTVKITVGAKDFDLRIWRVRASEVDCHRLHMCAHGREVSSTPLLKHVASLPAKLPPNNGSSEARVLAYLTGAYLDEHVNPERTGFDFETVHEGDMHDVSQEAILQTVGEEIEKLFQPLIARKRQDTLVRVRSFIESKRPVYRALLPTLDERLPRIDSDIDDDQLDSLLNEQVRKLEVSAEKEFDGLQDGPRMVAEDVYNALWDKIDTAAQVRLCQYVVKRKAVLEALKRVIAKRVNGESYGKEEEVHDLIFPMRRTSDAVPFERWNLWVIDEKLAFHSHLASDLRLDKLEVESQKRPDLLVFNRPAAFVEDDRTPYQSVVIVEFKRPMRENYKAGDLPHEQIQGYIEEIRAKKALTTNGRPISVTEGTRFYGYAICDLTPDLDAALKRQDFSKTPDESGYFKHWSHGNAYLEYISFEKLLRDAESRNLALFHRLGIISTTR